MAQILDSIHIVSSYPVLNKMTQIKPSHEIKNTDTNIGTETDVFHCMYCKETHTQLSSLMTHVKKMHKDHYGEAVSRPEHIRHKCLWCEEKFNKLSYLMSHIETNHPEQYTQAQNSKNLDRSKKEQILREGMRDERPPSSGSSSRSSPLVDQSLKNNNDKDIVPSVNKTDISKRITETVISEPKKFKKPRLHALDDITKDERNPPSELNKDSLPEKVSNESAIDRRIAELQSTSVPQPLEPDLHKTMAPTQFMSPVQRFQGPGTSIPTDSMTDAQSKLFLSPPPPSSVAGSSHLFTKLKEDAVSMRMDRHEEMMAPRPRGRPSKLASIMGFQGSSLLDMPSSESSRERVSGQYKCFWCDQTFKMRGRLMDHIDQQHKTSKEQQDKEASASIKQKLSHTDMAAPLPNSANGWPPSGGPFAAPSWPHTLPIPGYFFPQFNGLDYMYGRRASYPTTQQPTFPGPIPVPLAASAPTVSSCKFFKLGASRTRLSSSKIRASDILRKHTPSCRFYYLRLRDCGSVFSDSANHIPCCPNGNVQDDQPTISFPPSSEVPPEAKEFFRHPYLPDPRFHGMPWLSPGAGRRSSVPTILPMEVNKIKQEPSEDYAAMAAFASSSRYGRRGSFPLDLRNPPKSTEHGVRRAREYPL